MVATRVDTFGGMIPAVDRRLLPQEAATTSVNCWLYSGKMEPLRLPKSIHVCASPSTGKVYRIPTSYADSENLYESFWMEFSNPYTDVIRAPIFGDTHDRYYWASDSHPPFYNTRARILASEPAFLLGVPSPAPSPSLNISGGVSTDLVTRAYVVTYVTAYGEEGPPSVPVVGTGKVDDTWTLNSIPVPDADDMGVDRNITAKRIYRTITSSIGIATYFFITELSPATTTYADNASDVIISANDQLNTTTWTGPLEDFAGFIVMPNGILAAWRANEIWFSEPYRPHAWPAEYVQTVEFDIVGLGLIGQTLVACTQGFPVTATGSLPEAITTSKLMSLEPCTSRGSILSTPEGVYYASPNGLILVNPGRIENITRNLVTRDKWRALAGNARFRAARLGTAYFGYGSVSVTGVFEDEAFDDDGFASEDLGGTFAGVLIDPVDQRVAMSLLDIDTPVFGVQDDVWSGEVFVLHSGEVWWQDQSDVFQPYDVALWQSKVFQTADVVNVAAIKVDFELDDTVPELNPSRNTAFFQTLSDDRYAIFRLYADDRLVMTRELRKSGELLRPPSGFKSENWWFELESRVKITKVQMATSPRELINA